MKREIIKLADIPDFKSLLYEEDIYDEEGEICLYEFIDRETEYTNLEKCYEELRIVFMRVSDGKYFTFNYTYSPHWSDENAEEAEEVFPKEVTILIYE